MFTEKCLGEGKQRNETQVRVQKDYCDKTRFASFCSTL